jgi:hypothetical protein
VEDFKQPLKEVAFYDLRDDVTCERFGRELELVSKCSREEVLHCPYLIVD